MQFVAQRKENNSALAGGSARVHDHIGVQFIRSAWKHSSFLSSLTFQSALINLGAGRCRSAASKGLFPNPKQASALSSRNHTPFHDELLL